MNTNTIGNYNMKRGNCPRIWPEGKGGGWGNEQGTKITELFIPKQDVAFLRVELRLYL